MKTTGTIYADGRVQFHGYERMNSRLMAISDCAIVIHHGGGSYSDNGGRHYVSARIQTSPLRELRPGNEPGTWQFTLGGEPLGVPSYHPTPKEAVRAAMSELAFRGDKIAESVKDRVKDL